MLMFDSSRLYNPDKTQFSLTGAVVGNLLLDGSTSTSTANNQNSKMKMHVDVE